MGEHYPSSRAGPPTGPSSGKRQRSRSPKTAPRKTSRTAIPSEEWSFPSFRDARKSQQARDSSESIASSRRSSVSKEHSLDVWTGSNGMIRSYDRAAERASTSGMSNGSKVEDVIAGFIQNLRKASTAGSRYELAVQRAHDARIEFENLQSNFSNWPGIAESKKSLRARADKELVEAEAVLLRRESALTGSLKHLMRPTIEKSNFSGSDEALRASHDKLRSECDQAKIAAAKSQRQVDELQQEVQELHSLLSRQIQASQESNFPKELASLKNEAHKTSKLEEELQHHSTEFAEYKRDIEENITHLKEDSQRKYDQRINDRRELVRSQEECQELKRVQLEMESELEKLKTRMDQTERKTSDGHRRLCDQVDDQRTELGLLRSQIESSEVNAPKVANLSTVAVDEIRSSIQDIRDRVFGAESADQEQTILQRTNALSQTLSKEIDSLKEQINDINLGTEDKDTIVSQEFDTMRDEYKATIEEKGKAIIGILHDEIKPIRETLSALRDQDDRSTFVVGNVEAFRRDVGVVIEEKSRAVLRTLHETVSPMQEALKNLQEQPPKPTSAANGTHRDRTSHVGVNEEILGYNERFDAQAYAIQDLERRFDNLQTDELVQKMAHQMSVMYPAPANLQQAFDSVHREFMIFKRNIWQTIETERDTLKDLAAKTESAQAEATSAKGEASAAFKATDAFNHRVEQLEIMICETKDQLEKIWSPHMKHLVEDLDQVNKSVSNNTGHSAALERTIQAVREDLANRLDLHEEDLGSVQEEMDRLARVIGTDVPDWGK